MRDRGSPSGIWAAIAAVIIWALIPVGIRFFVLRIDPYLFNAIRFAASGSAAVPLLLRARPWRWPRADVKLLIGCAILAVPGYNIPVALGARTLAAGQLGLLIATEPVFIVVLTLLLKGQPIRRRVVIGSVLALGGVALTSIGPSTPSGFTWWSSLQVLFGAFCWSCYTVLSAPLNRRYGSFAVTGAILVVGTLALLVLSLPAIRDVAAPDSSTIEILCAMGLSSSLLGFLLWNYAAARVPAERMGLVLYLIPVVCVIAGAALLHEALSVRILLGGVLTVAGVWLASRDPPRAP